MKRARLWVVGCVSLALHAAVLALGAHVALDTPHARKTDAPIWLELSDAQGSAAHEAAPTLVPERTRVAAEPHPQRGLGPKPDHAVGERALLERAPAASSEPLARALTATPTSTPTQVQLAPAPEPEPRALPALDPRAIALSAQVDRALSARDEGAPPASEAARGAELSAYLKTYANARPNQKRPAPVLRRDPNGTCHYEGDAIEATILPDAGVVFADKPPSVTPSGGLAVPPEHPTTPEDQIAPQMFSAQVKVSGRAWQAEREWFLQQTVGLRRELADAAHARELTTSDRELTKQLDRIWCDGARSVEARKGALFALWDDTSPDDVGRRGRRVIVAYVRANLRKDSRFAYRHEELARLNARREQREPFEPYARTLGIDAADAGVP